MSYIDDIMGFNPSNLEAFQEPVNNSNFDANIYKTNPVKLSKAEDGHYRAKIRVLYNPFNFKQSIVAQRTYFIQDAEGSLLVRSKGASPKKEVYRECPFHKAWSKLWYATENQEAKRAWSRQMLNANDSQWVLVQVMEDENQPELVGKILAWKLPKTIYTKMTAKMNPAPETKKTPVAIMDFLIGLPLELDVAPGPDDPQAPERKQREINYDLCDFDSDYMPITKVDGTAFFTDEELDMIEAYNTAKSEMTKGKSAAKRTAAEEQVKAMTETIAPLYIKAMEYLKENAFDLEKECGYQEWDEATTARVNRYLDAVIRMEDPKIPTATTVAEPAQSEAPASDEIHDPMMDMVAGSDGVPF